MFWNEMLAPGIFRALVWSQRKYCTKNITKLEEKYQHLYYPTLCFLPLHFLIWNSFINCQKQLQSSDAQLLLILFSSYVSLFSQTALASNSYEMHRLEWLSWEYFIILWKFIIILLYFSVLMWIMKTCYFLALHRSHENEISQVSGITRPHTKL